MYLKKIKFINFRKFGKNDNEVNFVSSHEYSTENINIALATSLIVGKNNSGKTTVTKGLKKLTGNEKFHSTDFNFTHLLDVLKSIKQDDPSKYILPSIEFELTIELNNKEQESLVNLDKCISISSCLDSNLVLKIIYEIKEESVFINKVKEINFNKKKIFNKLLALIDNTDFQLNYYNNSDIKVNDFSLKNLIELKSIEANNIFSENALTIAFNKIMEYKHKNLAPEVRKELEEKVDFINEEIETRFYQNYKNELNKAINQIDNHVKVELESNITTKKIINSNGQYKYLENDFCIPENQYGLGYTNLMIIIAEIIDYVEKYPNTSSNNKINIISIEEPETYMHPQMQELFIEHINETIEGILKGREKKINCQILITTHSSHILNSKIIMGNSFNNINYLTTINNQTQSIPLYDEIINPELPEIKDIEEIKGISEKEREKNEKEREIIKKKNLSFLKKHIKYKVSEIFFSDAVILCEGVTEETLLKYFIGENPKLNKYYISIFNIGGAHGKLYDKLLKQLKIPCLIITDLDIKRSEKEKEDFSQITSLKGKTTTNQTLIYYLNTESINSLKVNETPYNIKIVFQDTIKKYYPSSFEESFILTNSESDILQKCLKTLKPNIYEKLIKDNPNESLSNITCNNSYRFQCKLSKLKSDFANTILYELSEIDGKTDIKLPDYINNGLKWIEEQLTGN